VRPTDAAARVLQSWAQGVAPVANDDPLPPHYGQCLGCGPDNPHGHHLQVWRDGDHAVRTEHTFDARHVGAPGIAHGGAVATVLDDLFGFLLYQVGELAVTRHLEVDYRAPVMLSTPDLLRAWLERRDGRKLFVRGEGSAGTGPVLVAASALFIVVGLDHMSGQAPGMGEVDA
jgi:acyl-coenzyme A thioesterase PaaI-like protein